MMIIKKRIEEASRKAILYLVFSLHNGCSDSRRKWTSGLSVGVIDSGVRLIFLTDPGCHGTLFKNGSLLLVASFFLPRARFLDLDY
jgi:hypothetical protein